MSTETNLTSKFKQSFPNALLGDWNLHIFDQLLGYQCFHQVQGDILEIGVLYGYTAALLAAALDDDERCLLIDPYADTNAVSARVIEFSQIEPKKLNYFQYDSRFVAKNDSHFFGDHIPQVRYAHIDGEHSYDAVYSDLELSFRCLAPFGLIVLDDIFSVPHACCTHAMFDYLRANPKIHCVALGFNKAYLCESRYLKFYQNFFSNLPDLLEDTAALHLRVCFNGWAGERSYLSLCERAPNEKKYQIIGKYCNSLDEVQEYLDAGYGA